MHRGCKPVANDCKYGDSTAVCLDISLLFEICSVLSYLLLFSVPRMFLAHLKSFLGSTSGIEQIELDSRAIDNISQC